MLRRTLARLDAANHERHVRQRFAAALRVHDHAAIGAQATGAIRRVRIVGANLAVRRVAVDHRIHVPRGHAEEQIRPPERGERVCSAPVRLIDDADPKSMRLEQPADQRHAEARVIDVRVAGDEDDVAGIPTELVHLGARGRQERRNAEPFRPERAIREQLTRHRDHGKRSVTTPALRSSKKPCLAGPPGP
jgi:hypothetical protein